MAVIVKTSPALSTSWNRPVVQPPTVRGDLGSPTKDAGIRN